jgi:hypothetical protein
LIHINLAPCAVASFGQSPGKKHLSGERVSGRRSGVLFTKAL